ncbi:tRNA (adenosine(37)-N6)-dimethylallyltransferase MiaA [Oceanobacillus sp. 1P07AA]|uniref:tRNA (adenosine(37)-N6)-dimethylallyltransferase MiaA n=1 Tax=Oceanobacillus sp. 1P07AA TaxID=3132293 RepID=UPI0039A6A8A3
MKETVISIVGPTAVGKSLLGIEMAKRFNGEVISGDSTQVYKGMDIGTAKVTKEEKDGIRHHMIDIIFPDESFSVADFQLHAKKCIDDVLRRGKLPILVGGSGLYIQALLYNYNFSEQRRDQSFTKRMEELIEQKGPDDLYTRLKEVDPVQAAKVHPNNHRRLIRALEVYETTGMTMTEYQQQQQLESPYNPIIVGLDMERTVLYDRINQRVDHMINMGLIEEVRNLIEQGYEDCQSMHAIGYKEIIQHISGNQPIEYAIDDLKQNSRKYAKRQLTWFRNKMNVQWYKVEPKLIEEKIEFILNDLAGILEDKSN